MRSPAPLLLWFIALAGCASDAPPAVPPGGVRVVGRIVDARRGSSFSREGTGVHGFVDATGAQVSAKPARESRFELVLPGREVRLRVAHDDGAYASPWEKSFVATGGVLDVEVRLQPTHNLVVRGRIAAVVRAASTGHCARGSCLARSGSHSTRDAGRHRRLRGEPRGRQARGLRGARPAWQVPRADDQPRGGSHAARTGFLGRPECGATDRLRTPLALNGRTANALRAAQEEVRSQSRWKHPYYWGASLSAQESPRLRLAYAPWALNRRT